MVINQLFSTCYARLQIYFGRTWCFIKIDYIKIQTCSDFLSVNNMIAVLL